MKSPLGVLVVVVAIIGFTLMFNRTHDDKGAGVRQLQPEPLKTDEASDQAVGKHQDNTQYGLTFTPRELARLSQSELAELVNIRIREKNNVEVELLLEKITIDLVSEDLYRAAMMSDNDEAVRLLLTQRVTISYSDLAWANMNADKKYIAILLKGACDQGVPYQSGGHKPCDTEVREQLLSH